LQEDIKEGNLEKAQYYITVKVFYLNIGDKIRENGI
jgi:hypothetical protein